MRDLAIIAALLGVLAGIVHLATRTKRLPDPEPPRALAIRAGDEWIIPPDEYTARLLGVPAPSVVSRPEMSAPGTSAEPDQP